MSTPGMRPSVEYDGNMLLVSLGACRVCGGVQAVADGVWIDVG